MKVSIVVPAYNVSKYISQTVHSLIDQSYKDIEIILVNDGSTDDTFEICKRLSQQDSRIKLFAKENSGLGLTRNFGMSKASGKFVIFIDGDDYVGRNFVEELIKKYDDSPRSLIISNRKRFYSDNNVVENDGFSIVPNVRKQTEPLHDTLSKKDYVRVGSCGVLYDLEIIRSNKILFKSEREYISEDIVFNFEYCKFVECYRLSFDAVYFYRKNCRSLTTLYDKDRFRKNVFLYSFLMKLYSSEYKYAISEFFLHAVRHCIKQEIQFGSRETLNRIIRDSSVKSALEIVRPLHFSDRIVYCLIKHNCTGLLVLLYRIKGVKYVHD